jgi:hypothetical protein
MTNPITPPQELRDKWLDEAPNTSVYDYLIDSAAQWGADQELEACVAWLQDPDLNVDTYKLRLARRPKLPSLKEQALNDLDTIQTHDSFGFQIINLSNIRRALEALPND